MNIDNTDAGVEETGIFKTKNFKTTIGEGHCWTDNGIVRIVVKDIYGTHVFRLEDEKQVDKFIAAVRECSTVGKQMRR